MTTSKPIIKFFIFLGVVLIFKVPYLTLITTYFHEKAHIKAAAKYGVDLVYKPDIILRIPHVISQKVHPDGISNFKTENDKEKFYLLDVVAKREISIAGIGSDIMFVTILTLFSLASMMALILLKDFNKVYIGLLYIALIIDIWLLFIVMSTANNLTNQVGDLTFLIQSITTK